jgi:hypothetical protein
LEQFKEEENQVIYDQLLVYLEFQELYPTLGTAEENWV